MNSSTYFYSFLLLVCFEYDYHSCFRTSICYRWNNSEGKTISVTILQEYQNSFLYSIIIHLKKTDITLLESSLLIHHGFPLILSYSFLFLPFFHDGLYSLRAIHSSIESHVFSFLLLSLSLSLSLCLWSDINWKCE